MKRRRGKKAGYSRSENQNSRNARLYAQIGSRVNLELQLCTSLSLYMCIYGARRSCLHVYVRPRRTRESIHSAQRLHKVVLLATFPTDKPSKMEDRNPIHMRWHWPKIQIIAVGALLSAQSSDPMYLYNCNKTNARVRLSYLNRQGISLPTGCNSVCSICPYTNYIIAIILNSQSSWQIPNTPLLNYLLFSFVQSPKWCRR